MFYFDTLLQKVRLKSYTLDLDKNWSYGSDKRLKKLANLTYKNVDNPLSRSYNKIEPRKIVAQNIAVQDDTNVAGLHTMDLMKQSYGMTKYGL